MKTFNIDLMYIRHFRKTVEAKSNLDAKKIAEKEFLAEKDSEWGEWDEFKAPEVIAKYAHEL